MKHLKIFAFTHKSTDLDQIGQLHIDDDQLQDRLTHLKSQLNIDELMYLSTCNRVEFMLVDNQDIDANYSKTFFQQAFPNWTADTIEWAVNNVQVFEGEEALLHLFRVSASIDSLVVGEREIITQVRNAYEKCQSLGLTGDLIRLVIKKAIETAKQVYTHTQIAEKPVSVVSLAYRKLRDLNVKLDARFLIVGSGVTNSNMSKYLKKHGFQNFSIFNRTLANAEKLATELEGKAYGLDALQTYDQGFDVLLTCTGAAEPIITQEVYQHLLQGDTNKKVVIDLAVPYDIDTALTETYDINLITVEKLQDTAQKNLKEREKELTACEQIIETAVEEFKVVLRTRKVELAMSAVPSEVKKIHADAIQTVFAKDLEKLDEDSKEVLEKIMNYVEKKYISVPMKMAKDILLDNVKH